MFSAIFLSESETVLIQKKLIKSNSFQYVQLRNTKEVLNVVYIKQALIIVTFVSNLEDYTHMETMFDTLLQLFCPKGFAMKICQNILEKVKLHFTKHIKAGDAL